MINHSVCEDLCYPERVPVAVTAEVAGRFSETLLMISLFLPSLVVLTLQFYILTCTEVTQVYTYIQI